MDFIALGLQAKLAAAVEAAQQADAARASAASAPQNTSNARLVAQQINTNRVHQNPESVRTLMVTSPDGENGTTAQQNMAALSSLLQNGIAADESHTGEPEQFEDNGDLGSSGAGHILAQGNAQKNLKCPKCNWHYGWFY